MKKLTVSCALVILCGALASTHVWAQTEQSPLKVPANGAVNLKTFPQVGEEIFGALTTTHVDPQPAREYFGNTLTCTVSGLWECHTWLNADGTGVQFQARKKADGSIELGSSAFTYRFTGKPGDFHFCMKRSGSDQEVCRKEKWEEGHFLYDEWFDNYDAPQIAGFPSYKNVHEQHAIVPKHQ